MNFCQLKKQDEFGEKLTVYIKEINYQSMRVTI